MVSLVIFDLADCDEDVDTSQEDGDAQATEAVVTDAARPARGKAADAACWMLALLLPWTSREACRKARRVAAMVLILGLDE